MSSFNGENRKPMRQLLGVAMILTVVGLLYPLETETVPTWRIQVVDEIGNPIGDIAVRQIWQNYTIENDQHEQDLAADKLGYVTFPRRTTRALLLRRIFYPFSNALGGVHASWGAHASVIVLVPDATKEIGSVSWEQGEPLPQSVAVHSLRSRQKQ